MKKILKNLFITLASLSPYFEVLLRKIYWHNYKLLSKFNPYSNNNSLSNDLHQEPVDFDEVIEKLKEWGVGEGTLLIIHSSYDNLKVTGLSPLSIIEKLKELVGETGTLAMPVIRRYKEEPSPEEKWKDDYCPPECTYDVRRTPVSSGMLPSIFMRLQDTKISLHPLNPLCALGPLAEEMMKHDIEGESPSPHGRQSPWYYCYEHNAMVISLGTDLLHHNTINHVAQEAFDDWRWSDEEWYNIRKFRIITLQKKEFLLNVKERKPKWGMLHSAELMRYKDFCTNGIIKSAQINGLLIEAENSRELIDYMRSRGSGYPYLK